MRGHSARLHQVPQLRPKSRILGRIVADLVVIVVDFVDFVIVEGEGVKVEIVLVVVGGLSEGIVEGGESRIGVACGTVRLFALCLLLAVSGKKHKKVRK